MPVVENDQGILEALCDYCNTFVHKDKKWMESYGYLSGKPTVAIMCTGCYLALLQGGTPVKGYGIVSAAQIQELNKDSEGAVAEKTRRKSISNEELSTKLDWPSIEVAIKAKQLRVSALAEELNANPVELRKLIETHFGDKIYFKRGRSGGVFWNQK